MLQYGFHANGTRQKRIDCLCMLLARSHADEPARFVDLRKSASISGLFLAPTGNQETSTRDFLYTMLLGAELLLRLRKQPALTSYQSIMNDYTSTLIVIAVTFMANVIIQDLGHNPRGFGSSSSRYVFVAADHRRRSEALIRFGETLAWPLIEQARDYMERAYDMITRAQPVNLYLCDWLFGLVLPGKYFRHRAMSCLVLASQGSKHLGPAPYYDSGLIIAGKSYWPTRTVLGRVLGGLRRAPTQGGSVGRAVCGWLGPAPVPKDESGRAIPDGWILLFARDIDFPVPVVKSANALADLGLAEADGGPIEDPVDVVESLTNPDEWICPTPPSRPAVSTVRFKGIRLERMPTVSAAGAGMSLFSSFGQLPTRYRPILDFDVAGASVSYVLYANPVFVAAPPCVVMHAGGGHVVHRRQALRYLAATVPVAQLKTTYPEAGKLLIINAMGGGDEELIARAWCAERGKSAVIRRNVLNQECCFACACAVASGSTGLAVDVLIWSS